MSGLPSLRNRTRCAGLVVGLLAAVLVSGQTPSFAQETGAGKAMDPAAANTFHVDPVHSMALFRIQHQGVGMFHGRFNRMHGTVKFDPAAATPLEVNITIPVAGVDTGSEKIDNHLKNPDFFDAEQFPNMSFESTSSKKLDASTFEVSGKMTIHGVTRDLQVKFDLVGSADSERGKRYGFESSFVIQRTDFGMGYGVEKKALGNEVRVTVALELLPGAPPEERADAPRGPGRAGGMRDRLLALDKDGNGKIEKAEVPEDLMRLFERMDANQDGVVDEKELANPPRRGGGQ